MARLFDRPLGQNLLALACASVLFLAGARERAKRPADDLPPEHETPPIRTRRPPRRPGAAAEATTKPLPPPEFKPYEPHSGEQLHLRPDDQEDS